MNHCHCLIASPCRLVLLVVSLLLACSASAAPRVVALEYSFVDALALVQISPVGIADDGKPQNLLPRLREQLAPWQSLGSRAQPSLEDIARLKPDLILADVSRHSRVHAALERIAPTLLLPSRGSTYQQVLDTARRIGHAVGRSEQMQQRLARHTHVMERYRERFSHYAGSLLFAAVSDQGIWLHSPSSFAGSMMQTLGLNTPLPATAQAYQPGNLELLLRLNPDWLLTGAYGSHTLLDDWRQLPLFNRLRAQQHNQLVPVSPQLWSLGRGVFAAEAMAAELDTLLGPQLVNVQRATAHAQ